MGVCGIFKHFSGFEFFLLPNRIPARPYAGNASRWQELRVKTFCGFQNFVVCQISVLSLESQVSFFSKVAGLPKSVLCAAAFFLNLSFSKIGVALFLASFVFGFVRFSKLASRLRSKFWQAVVFIGQSQVVWQSPFSA